MGTRLAFPFATYRSQLPSPPRLLQTQFQSLHSRYDQHVHEGDRTGHPGRCRRAGAERLRLRGQRPNPYATGSMTGSGMGGGSATATNTPIYTGAASAQKAAGGVAGLGLALIGLL